VTAPSTAYRRLALASVVSTFVLIVLGGVVRVTNSGLGCGAAGSGFHGWPLCRGDVIPGASIHTAIEYTHRAVASAVALLLLVLAVQAWRRYRAHRGIVWASTAAFGLVLAQGLLGAATVEKDLNEGLVAAHLGLAMLLLGLTIYLWRATRHGVQGAKAAPASGRFRGLAIASSAAVFCTVVAGGYMAGTQNYGRAGYHIGDGAHHACGKEFPSCNGGFLPFGQSRLVDIQLTHRVFMFISVILLLALVVVALRRRPSRRVVQLAWGVAAILVVQVLLGALNVWLDEYEALIVAHLAVGTLLWAAVLGLTLQLYPVPAPREAEGGERPRAETEAVAA
jgi:heme A synthase